MGAYRIALFLLLPWLLVQFSKGRVKLGIIDLMMIVTAAWFPISFTQNYDISVGIEAGGAQSVDMLLAYFIGRASLRNFGDLGKLLLVMAPGLFLAGFSVMVESIGGRLIVREIAQSIFGGANEVGGELRYEYRSGLLRAYGPFSHPIHAGVYLTSFVPLFFVMFRKSSRKTFGIIIGALSFFALSSAGVLGLLLNLVLLGFDRVQREIKDIGWGMALSLLAALLLIVQIFSKSGVVSVIYRYLTFNPATGYFRTLIWEYAGADALRHPWFGIGYEAYLRPSWFGTTTTIDAHYLAMAVKYGLLPALLFFAVGVSLVVMLARRAIASPLSSQRSAFVGMAICISIIIILLFTVTLWGSMFAWFCFLLGMFFSLARNPQNYNSKYL